MEATETSIIALPDIDTSQNQDPTLDVTISDTMDGSGVVIHNNEIKMDGADVRMLVCLLMILVLLLMILV